MKKTFKTFTLMLLTAFALSSCVDVPAPFNLPDKSSNSGGNGGTETLVEPAGEGTLNSPYNVAAIVALINEMEAGVESTQEYYVKGKVLAVKTDEATISQYGNHTFTIVDEGTSSPVFTAFQVYGPDKKKFTSVDDIKVGDEVIVCGKVVNYRGNTPETVGKGAAYVVSINGSGDDGGGGTEDEDAISVSCVIAAQMTADLPDNTSSAETYAITGYITKVIGAVSTKYGTPQQSFWMADKMADGEVFQAYYANLPEGVSEFTVGMKVKITGKLLNYKNANGGGAAEMKNATVVILEEGGGGETPPVGDVQHITIAEFLAKADVNTTYELTGTVSNITNTTYGNFDLVEDGSSIYIYGLLDLNGQKQKFASLGIEEGDKVTLTGKYKLYNNKPEIADAQFVSVVKGDGGQGGDTPGPTPGPGGDEVTELVNGGFEEWVTGSTTPVGWKSASSASNATLSQSQDAHGGSYACLVAAPGSANKRLATQEITLEAGTYTFSFYAKSTTADKSQTKGGYVPVADGAVGAYKYGDFFDLNNNGWTLVSYEFTLEATTTVCLVVMNPKDSNYSKSQDILVDDATLVKK